MNQALHTRLPEAILLEHEGQWVAWDGETGEFFGAADTFDELAEKVEPVHKNRLIGYERVVPRDAIMVGGL